MSYKTDPAPAVFAGMTYASSSSYYWNNLDRRFLDAMPDGFLGKLTGIERARMTDLLFALWSWAEAVGKEKAEQRQQALQDNEIDARADDVAKQKLAWVLSNWGNLGAP